MAEPGSTERPASEVFNEKFDAFRKFASTSFTRAKQFTVEKLGRADSVTSYDTEFEDLCHQVDQIKLTTERVLVEVENMIQPNPGKRIETMVYSKLDRQQPHRASPHELLGIELSRAGNEFGPETQYGGYLVRCGVVENKIGTSERRLENKVRSDVITPLKAFLEVDIKNTLRDRRSLIMKRLDLDACKAQVKKVPEGEKLQQAESQLRSVQAEYEMDMDKLRTNMTKIVQTHVNNLGQMKALMAAIKAYHVECISHIEELDTNVATPQSSISGSLEFGGSGSMGVLEVHGVTIDNDKARKARVMYDYDADKEDEVTVFSDQIIVVYPIEDSEDYVMARVDTKYGKIPVSYIEYL